MNKRLKLKDIGANERHKFKGTFERTGFKNSYKTYSPTILLTNIFLDDSNELVTKHLWFNYGKQFLKLGVLKKGEKISFNARVSTYTKGRFGDIKHDYKLERPTKINKVNGINNGDMPLDNKAVIGYIMEDNKQFYLKNNRPYDPYYIDSYKEWKNKN